jgi:hypothetical protein
MEGNIGIYRLPKGRGTDQWKWYYIAWAGGEGNIISTGPYHDPRQSVYPDIALYISNYIVFIALKTRIWHIQYKCIEIFNQVHWRFP